VSDSSVSQLDLATGKMTALPTIQSGLPTLSWPCGLTFDTKRNQLIVSSLGGDGFLYAYSLQSKQWSMLSNLRGTDLQALTYSAADDSFYGLTTSSLRPGLVHFDASGTALSQVQLSQPIPGGSQGSSWPDQLVAVGDQLAVITPPTVDLYEPEILPQARFFLINPKTGLVNYSGTIVPEPAALLLIPLGMLLLSRPMMLRRHQRLYRR